MSEKIAAYEKIGSFYLGRRHDPAAPDRLGEPVLYDARDLTTHAVCVGMTGSGKTGLCLSLLEEAALDAVPAIAIDPKGDIGNLLLTFPELRPEDFRPWIDEADASRHGLSPDEHAETVATKWKEGLAAWDQDGNRIARLRAASDLALYTPGSSTGRPLALLRSLHAPPSVLLDDRDALQDLISGAVAGVLGLVGVDADPVRSREHILLSRIFEDAWRGGTDVTMPDLIQAIQKPPFERLGVLDLESFFPAADRFALAMALNNLIAAPAFAAWRDGEPLDVQRLLWTERGTPRVSILSIAHLSDAERMFFVTVLLSEIVAWMRTQPGSSSLRAVLYMDEVFGFFPPVANPPSKPPMLTLLKQARAYGLGVVLATQNPVDLDYKGLSNAGTWFLGRLQTQRDKDRVLDGLESAGASPHGYDRRALDALLSGLDTRVFLMHNVHDDAPVLFRTRWAMSYLRGPLTRNEIRRLAEGAARLAEGGSPVTAAARAQDARERAQPVAPPPEPPTLTATIERPLLPDGIVERFVDGPGAVYRPRLLGRGRVHYVDAKRGVDHWQDVALLAALGDGHAARDPWDEAAPTDPLPRLGESPRDGAAFAELPPAAARPDSYDRWQKQLASHLYRSVRLTIWHAPAVASWSAPDESESAFRIRVTQAARERRDQEVEKVRQRHAARFATLEDQRRRAEERVSRESAQLGQQKLQTAVSVGATLLSALMGRRLTTARTVDRAATSVRGAGRIGRELEDVERARENLETVAERIRQLEEKLETELAEIRDRWDPAAIQLEPREVPPRKSDITAERPLLVWQLG